MRNFWRHKKIIAIITFAAFSFTHTTPLKLIDKAQDQDKHHHAQTNDSHDNHKSKHPCCVNNTYVATPAFSAEFLPYDIEIILEKFVSQKPSAHIISVQARSPPHS